jgi:hypothetical protein
MDKSSLATELFNTPRMGRRNSSFLKNMLVPPTSKTASFIKYLKLGEFVETNPQDTPGLYHKYSGKILAILSLL